MSDNGLKFRPGDPRSIGANPQRRVPQAWPKDRRFRILSIDGGGIKGIFPAAVLAGLEKRYTGGESIAAYFDLIVGTSTGGIIALGLGAGYAAADLLDLYSRHGCEVFPPLPDNAFGRLRGWFRDKSRYTHYIYNREALRRLLMDQLGERLLGDSTSRMCIPSFEGKNSEVYVFKTPHHADYKHDRCQRMVDVGLATSAAPSYFQPYKHGGYTLVDGGVWANNPIMLAVIEALTTFDIERDQIDVLSIGCGDDRYIVTEIQVTKGGLLHWKNIIYAAMRLQSLAATNQARLLLGPPSVVRIDAPTFEPRLSMDDWRRSLAELVPAAESVLTKAGEHVAKLFLGDCAAPYFAAPISVDMGSRQDIRP
jgi:patatin-like phospholipase/acyl hydrolase